MRERHKTQAMHCRRNTFESTQFSASFPVTTGRAFCWCVRLRQFCGNFAESLRFPQKLQTHDIMGAPSLAPRRETVVNGEILCPVVSPGPTAYTREASRG